MSDTVKVDRKLKWAQNAVETITAHNKSAQAVEPGDVVVLDTADSTAEEVAFDVTTKYLIRDNDKIFSEDIKLHIKRFGLEDTPTAPRSGCSDRWQDCKQNHPRRSASQL